MTLVTAMIYGLIRYVAVGAVCFWLGMVLTAWYMGRADNG